MTKVSKGEIMEEGRGTMPAVVTAQGLVSCADCKRYFTRA